MASQSSGLSQIGIQVLLGFIATLIATLIGVQKGFEKDRKAQQKDAQTRVLNHLVSIREELEVNEDIATANHSVISELQADQKQEANHYSLSLLTNDAWRSGLEGRLNERINTQLFRELQQIYSDIESTNEQIKRLRTEPLHRVVGEEEDFGPIEVDVWTISVKYWDRESESVEQTGLGDLIQTYCTRIRISIRSVEGELDEEIAQLESAGGSVDDKETGATKSGFNRFPSKFFRN